MKTYARILLLFFVSTSLAACRVDEAPGSYYVDPIDLHLTYADFGVTRPFTHPLELTLTNNSEQIEYRSTSDQWGKVRLEKLLPGEYAISVTGRLTADEVAEITGEPDAAEWTLTGYVSQISLRLGATNVIEGLALTSSQSGTVIFKELYYAGSRTPSDGQYRNDGATTSILASSLWLNEDITFVPETMQQLSDTYYASAFQGEMGSDGFNQALQDWINAQTGGLLKDQMQDITLDADTVLALATTIYYQAKWDSTFSEENTSSETFHALSGDVTCDFLHGSSMGNYYWGDQFGAVSRRLENDGGTMWFLLPDEGVSVEALLQDSQAMDFLLSGETWENSQYLTIHLALPKFDISSQMDLREGLQALGVTDVFDPDQSNFTPMTQDLSGIYVSQAKHGVRVAVDEEGVTAAAYTVMSMTGAGAPPEEEIDFTLDRPFLFAITSDDGLPLFVGTVYQPVT